MIFINMESFKRGVYNFVKVETMVAKDYIHGKWKVGLVFAARLGLELATMRTESWSCWLLIWFSRSLLLLRSMNLSFPLLSL